jgi:aminoglycoside phosphotransferase (APT) family kinase protein
VTERGPAARARPTPAQLAWVERTLGSGARVISVRRLPGGITSAVHRLSVRLPGGDPGQVVLKRYTDPDWGDAQAVRNEAAALAAVEPTSVPAPRLLGASPDGNDTDGVPSLLMTRAPGRVCLAPRDLDAWIRELAALLPVLHAGLAEVRAFPPRDVDSLAVPASANRPEVWTAARRAIESEPPIGEPVFVHGDYQHFNVLWWRGHLSALVDWSSARVAHPDIDVGHCRLNLAVLHSVDVAERFRLAYESEAGRRVDPWWDIHQLLAYDDGWREFIPIQVAGRAPLDVRGMTDRVEAMLATTLARM